MNESSFALAWPDALTRDNAVLLLIDHQVGPLWELEFTTTRRRVVDLATVARQLGVPTIVSTIAPDSWGPVIPELGAAIGGDRVIVRRMVNAWDEPRVRRAVELTGRTKLLIAGSVVDVAVVMCALGAAGAGYEVYAPIDASGQASHRALVRLARAGVIVTTTSLVNGELLSDDGEARVLPMRGAAGHRIRSCIGQQVGRRSDTPYDGTVIAQSATTLAPG
jgi:nicotinamidase-related amidase